MRLRTILIAAVCLLVLGWSSTVAYGQDDAEYAGTRECRDCHRSLANDQAEMAHAMTLVEVAEADDDANPVLADFTVGEDLRTVQFPGEDSTRPFDANDISFTLGAGRHVQAYVTETGDDVYVLPAQWNSISGEWEALTYAEAWPDPAYDFRAECAACHTTAFDSTQLEWREAGVHCEACHGPGSNHIEIADDAGSSISDEEYAALSGAINFALDGQVCGRCHIRGTSADGLHPYPLDYRPGDDLLGENGFVPAATSDETHWLLTGHARLPNMQYNEWLESAHPQALSSAQESDSFTGQCLTCHSVAQVRVNYLIDEDWVDEDEFDPLSTLDDHGFGVTCVSCHDPHEEDAAALLRDDDKPYALCTNCHADSDITEGVHHPVQEMFEGQAFVDEIKPVEGAHFGAEDGPTCVTCHMPTIETKSGQRNSHTFHIVSPGMAGEHEGVQNSCTACHTDVQNPAAMQSLIDSVQSNVSSRVATAREQVDDTTPDWVVTALDAVEGDGSQGIHNYSYTNAMLMAVEDELGLVSGTISDADISGMVDDVMPDIAPAEIPTTVQATSAPASTGLTGPSFLLLAIAGFIIAFAAYAFFVRGGRDD